MSIEVSAGASFVLGASDKCCILWKRMESQSTVYEVFAYFDAGAELPPNVFCNNKNMCCFSNDMKFAVFCYQKYSGRRFVVINLDTGMVTDEMKVRDCWKVFSIDMVVIFLHMEELTIFNLHTREHHTFDGPVLPDDKCIEPSKLSPVGSVLAIPDMFGDMLFCQLRIPKYSLPSNRLKEW